MAVKTKKARQLLVRLGQASFGHYPSQRAGSSNGGHRPRFSALPIALADNRQKPGHATTSDSGFVFQLKEEEGLTLVVVSHDRQFASRFPAVWS